MFAFPSTVLLGEADREAPKPESPGQAQLLPLSSLCLPQQEGLTTRCFLCTKSLGKYAVLGLHVMWGPRSCPGSTHPAGATSWLPSPGPKSCDLPDTPKLSKAWLELCPFALSGMVGTHTGGARQGSARFQEGQLLSGWGTLGPMSKQAEEVDRPEWGREPQRPPCCSVSRAFSRLFLSLFSEKL